MSYNPWKELESLVAGPGLQVGVVTVMDGALAVVQLPGGGIVKARGEASVGQTVFIRGDVIEGEAGATSIEILTL